MCGLIGGEFLITVDGQAFFQAELEPVLAGDAIARPVVEIFVANDGFDAFKVAIGRGFGMRKDVFGVENIQPLVFHRAHIEIRGGDYHEAFQIQR